MKKSCISLVLAVVSHTALCTAFLTDKDSTTRTIREDTTAREETVLYGPFGNRKVNSLGYYATTVDDKQAFHLSSGIGIFNTLRGQVPNAEMSPSALSTSFQLRGGNPLLVIDGLPVSGAMKGNYNLNSFEYQRISAISSGNAVAGIYGGSGMNGALLLQSKTGENYDQATVEVNSYSTLTSRKSFVIDDNDNSEQQWVLSNSVAYMQDFGKVDTRVSLNYTPSPSQSSEEDLYARSYAFRINTGVAITKRLNARVILDSYYKKNSMGYSLPYYPNGTQRVDSEGHQKLLQGNLALTYQVLDWLTISSQGSLSKAKTDSQVLIERQIPDDLPGVSFQDGTTSQPRSFLNFFVSANKKLSTDLSLTAFTGFQYEKYKPVRKSGYRYNSGLESGASRSEQRLEYKTKSWLNGVGLNYREFVFTDLTYRRDMFHDDHSDTYSASASFVYSEAFHLTGKGFSFGRIRGSFGKTDLVNMVTYPYTWPATEYDLSSQYPVSGKNLEAGTDLGFVNNRITLHFSYFKNTNDNSYIYIPGWGSGYGTPSFIMDLGALKTSGWEVALGTTPLKNKNVQLSTKLTWGKYKIKLDGGESPGIDLPFSIANTNPDWRAGLLNQLTWKSLFFSFLIDMRKGGDFTGLPPGVYPATFQDGTQAKLRDVSVGIDLTPRLLGKIGIKEATLSVSGRNLWTIYSKSSKDVEDPMDTMSYMKSGSLSLSLRF